MNVLGHCQNEGKNALKTVLPLAAKIATLYAAHFWTSLSLDPEIRLVQFHSSGFFMPV